MISPIITSVFIIILLDSQNVIPTPAPTPPNSCKAGEMAYVKGCYSLMTNAQDWQSASVYCKNKGAELVDIHGPGENAAILLTMFQGKVDKLWIGLHKKDVRIQC